MEHRPLSVKSASDVSDGDNDNGSTTRTKKVLKTPFRLLVVSVLLGTMALAGISRFGLPRTNKEQHLSPSMQYKNLMMAFSAHLHPSKISKAHVNTFLKAFTERMLQENDGFTGSLKALFNQQDAAVPNKMSVKFMTTPPTEKGSKQALRIKLAAQPGQQENLIKNLKKIDPQLPVKAEQPNLAVVELLWSQDGEIIVSQALVDALTVYPKTDIELELGASKTLEEIHADKDKNIVEAIKGLKFSATMKTAHAIFGAFKKMGEAEGMKVNGELDDFMQGIAKLGFSTELLYKSPDQFNDLPTLIQHFDVWKSIVGDMSQGTKDFIKDLPTTCAGIDGVTYSGGNLPKDFVVKFTNFKPMLLVADIIKELEEVLS